MHEVREHCDVVVIGCGGMGAATCRHLAARGVGVVGLEQFQRGHTRGSSHGHSRVVRQAYFEHPDYVPLLKRSFELWEDLERESGVNCLFRVGALFAGSSDSGVYAGSLNSARTHGLEVEDLDHEALESRFPQFAFPPDAVGVYEPGAGFVIPEAGIEANLGLAEGDGAEIREETRVTAIEPEASGVVVRTTGGSLLAQRVVVTAGAWTSRLLAHDPMPLEVHRKVLCWFAPQDESACDCARMPAWIIDGAGNDLEGDYYGIPTWESQPGPPGVKIGFHGPGTVVDPVAYDATVSPEVIERFRRDVSDLLPGVLGDVTHATTCLYTMTPDQHFLIDHAPEDERIVVACGFSGHGYKFAPVVGEILADMAINGETSHPIAFLNAR